MPADQKWPRWPVSHHRSYWDGLDGLRRGHSTPHCTGVHIPTYCNRWYHWQPRERSLRVTLSAPARAAGVPSGPTLWACKPESWPLWQCWIGHQVPQILLLSFLVAVKDKRCPVWFLSSSYWFLCGQIKHSAFHTWVNCKRLDPRVGLFMCVWMCILIMCI